MIMGLLQKLLLWTLTITLLQIRSESVETYQTGEIEDPHRFSGKQQILDLNPGLFFSSRVLFFLEAFVEVVFFFHLLCPPLLVSPHLIFHLEKSQWSPSIRSFPYANGVPKIL